MDCLYKVEDPWGLNSEGEHFRFKETIRLIKQRIGSRFDSILEIGCGEGLQTGYLAHLGSKVVAIDPSINAIKRAEARSIKNASFEVGDFTKYRNYGQRFDLVTACEVIYYAENPETTYDRLSELGRHCLITYYEEIAPRLDGFFSKQGVSMDTIGGQAQKWRIVWWSANRDAEA